MGWQNTSRHGTASQNNRGLGNIPLGSKIQGYFLR